MEMQEVISRAERNIRQALRDYGAHTSKTDVLEDVTDEFIYRLAADSSYAKQGLRKLFSKSPVWNEELDALVINGTRWSSTGRGRMTRTTTGFTGWRCRFWRSRSSRWTTTTTTF